MTATSDKLEIACIFINEDPDIVGEYFRAVQLGFDNAKRKEIEYGAMLINTSVDPSIKIENFHIVFGDYETNSFVEMSAQRVMFNIPGYNPATTVSTLGLLRALDFNTVGLITDHTLRSASFYSDFSANADSFSITVPAYASVTMNSDFERVFEETKVIVIHASQIDSQEILSKLSTQPNLYNPTNHFFVFVTMNCESLLKESSACDSACVVIIRELLQDQLCIDQWTTEMEDIVQKYTPEGSTVNWSPDTLNTAVALYDRAKFTAEVVDHNCQSLSSEECQDLIYDSPFHLLSMVSEYYHGNSTSKPLFSTISINIRQIQQSPTESNLSNESPFENVESFTLPASYAVNSNIPVLEDDGSIVFSNNEHLAGDGISKNLISAISISKDSLSSLKWAYNSIKPTDYNEVSMDIWQDEGQLVFLVATLVVVVAFTAFIHLKKKSQFKFGVLSKWDSCLLMYVSVALLLGEFLANTPSVEIPLFNHCFFHFVIIPNVRFASLFYIVICFQDFAAIILNNHLLLRKKRPAMHKFILTVLAFTLGVAITAFANWLGGYDYGTTLFALPNEPISMIKFCNCTVVSKSSSWRVYTGVTRFLEIFMLMFLIAILLRLIFEGEYKSVFRKRMGGLEARLTTVVGGTALGFFFEIFILFMNKCELPKRHCSTLGNGKLWIYGVTVLSVLYIVIMVCQTILLEFYLWPGKATLLWVWTVIQKWRPNHNSTTDVTSTVTVSDSEKKILVLGNIMDDSFKRFGGDSPFGGHSGQKDWYEDGKCAAKQLEYQNHMIPTELFADNASSAINSIHTEGMDDNKIEIPRRVKKKGNNENIDDNDNKNSNSNNKISDNTSSKSMNYNNKDNKECNIESSGGYDEKSIEDATTETKSESINRSRPLSIDTTSNYNNNNINNNKTTTTTTATTTGGKDSQRKNVLQKLLTLRNRHCVSARGAPVVPANGGSSTSVLIRNGNGSSRNSPIDNLKRRNKTDNSSPFKFDLASLKSKLSQSANNSPSPVIANGKVITPRGLTPRGTSSIGITEPGSAGVKYGSIIRTTTSRQASLSGINGLVINTNVSSNYNRDSFTDNRNITDRNVTETKRKLQYRSPQLSTSSSSNHLSSKKSRNVLIINGQSSPALPILKNGESPGEVSPISFNESDGNSLNQIGGSNKYRSKLNINRISPIRGNNTTAILNYSTGTYNDTNGTCDTYGDTKDDTHNKTLAILKSIRGPKRRAINSVEVENFMEVVRTDTIREMYHELMFYKSILRHMDKATVASEVEKIRKERRDLHRTFDSKCNGLHHIGAALDRALSMHAILIIRLKRLLKHKRQQTGVIHR